MEPPYYPYATLEKDGFQLAVVEQGDTTRVLAVPLASDARRFATKPGDMVKLIFEYRELMQDPDGVAEYGAEHMWVEVVDYRDECLIGRLDNSPRYTKLLKSGDAVAFHPKHVIAFYPDAEKG